MRNTHFARRALQRITSRPRWLSWLELAPLSVQEADTGARRTLVTVQLPAALAVSVIFASAKQLSWFESAPLMAMGLSGAGLIVLIWPLCLWRVAIAAHRSAANVPGRLGLRLRYFAVFLFITVASACVAIFGLLGLIIFVAVAT